MRFQLTICFKDNLEMNNYTMIEQKFAFSSYHTK